MSKGLREEIEEIFDGENERFVYTDVFNDTVDTILSIIQRESNKAVIEELQDALSLWSSGETKEHVLNRIKVLKKQIGEE